MATAALCLPNSSNTHVPSLGIVVFVSDLRQEEHKEVFIEPECTCASHKQYVFVSVRVNCALKYIVCIPLPIPVYGCS